PGRCPAPRRRTGLAPRRFRPARRTPRPLQATLDQLKGLATTLVITDEADALRDEGEQYANKLDVTSVRVAGMVHDFLFLDGLRNTRAANIAR
ncbi:alpha/beta hydrolase fold domain-containing protein, partial [Streptomyces sp. NPDC056689]|uniref:alpha/beta hydrolase fold domain-containing protein n=1 Tax=Streptomyces sp. NPDC056689 TaxID=3345911 RepID=UPI0036D048CA